jgi:hypothetical protein
VAEALLHSFLPLENIAEDTQEVPFYHFYNPSGSGGGSRDSTLLVGWFGILILSPHSGPNEDLSLGKALLDFIM